MHTITFVLWSDINGKVMSLPDIQAKFARYPLWEVLDALQRMEYLLATAARPDTDVQDRIGAGLFGAPRWQHLRAQAMRFADLSDGQRGLVFWHTQLILNASKIAFLASPDAVQQSPKLDMLGEAVLGLSDHLEPNIDALPETEQTKHLNHYVTVNLVFNEKEHLKELLGVAQHLYLNRHETLRAHSQWVDMRGLLDQALDMDAETFTAIGAAAWCFYLSQDTHTIHEGAPVLDLHSFLRTTAVSSSDVDSFLAKTSRTEVEMRATLSEQYTLNDLRPFSFLPFAETPLVRVHGRTYCLSFKLLLRRLTTDLHFFYLKNLSEPLKRAYLTFQGVAFEDVVHRTLRRGSRRRRGSRYADRVTHYYEVDLIDSAKSATRADGILVRGDTAVVLDAKAGRLPAPVLSGDVDALHTYLETNLLKAARQIHYTIERIRDGSLVLAKRTQIKTYIPLLVTLQHIGWSPLMQRWLEEQLGAEGILQHSEIKPLQVAELGSLLVVTDTRRPPGQDVLSLLTRRASDEVWSGMSLHNCLVQLGDEFDWRTPVLRGQITAYFEVLRTLLKPPADAS